MIMKLKFYGVRGSIPSPISSSEIEKKIKNAIEKYVAVKNQVADMSIDSFVEQLPLHEKGTYGGNTTCLEVVADSGDHYIFDAGSGIRELGMDMMKKGGNLETKIHITHDHWDHIQGLPFFVPAYVPGNDVKIISGDKKIKDGLEDQQRKSDGTRVIRKQDIKYLTAEDKETNRTKEVFEGQQDYEKGYFPVPVKYMGAKPKFGDIKEGERVENGITLSYKIMNHPQGVFCYSMQEGSKKVVFGTDYENDGQLKDGKYEAGEWDKKFIEHAKNSDVLILDAQYTLDEHSKKKNWGHSDLEAICWLAKEANAKMLVATHFDPTSTDLELHKREQFCKEYAKSIGYKGTVEFAYEGKEITL
jgi:phosphoribosyl 1,2-cyclic phosphodiesterase